MANSLTVGSPAPDFTLAGITLEGSDAVRRDYTLSAERGHPVVLAFYPKDESMGCTAQLCSYQSELTGFTDLGAEIWAISMQDVDSHEKFARKEKLTFPLLADTDGAVVKAYDIQLAGLGLKRSIFVIDADGVLRWKHIPAIGLRFQSAATIREQLALL